MPQYQNKYLFDLLTFSEKNSTNYSAYEWEVLLRQAKASVVDARLSVFCNKFQLFSAPQFVMPHLSSAETYWLSQKRIVNWELYNIQNVFGKLQIPLILLKGTAYSAADLNAGFGRVFSDIDILVPKQHLIKVRDALKWSGWFAEKMSDYDRLYYEKWMHELPPLKHFQRGTSLDIHHNIIPETSALCPDAALLLGAAVNIPNTPYWTLCQEDMVLHSATHLFWGGEFDNGLRDLSDLDLLLREFSQNNPCFWQKLLDRADVLGLREPLFYAWRYTAKLLKTPIPENVSRQSGFSGNNIIKIKIMDFLFLRALLPVHPTCDDYWTGLARWCLYVRSHWLKMPWYLLLPHLSRKAWMRLTSKEQL